MDLTNLSAIKSLLKKNNIYIQKNFGQNFLLDRNIIKKILQAAELSKDDNVLEIGPGLGVLTCELADNVRHLTSVELDRNMVPILKEVMKDYTNFCLVEKNILKYIPEYKAYKVVANIPYNITGQILRYFLEILEDKPKSLTFMVQKEVADKIIASKGHHNLLSLSCQNFSIPKIISYVDKNKFFPVPKVDSAIIHLDVLQKPLIKDTERFFYIIRKAFQMKRKTLHKSLLLDYSFLEKININKDARPQELDFDDWSKILDIYSIF
jgi:16S rRNA (adenine1518-N6/adenine1519-N6)-dimethyltransferase